MADEVSQIKSRLDIVDIIGESVNLRKAGRNFRGLCPFHQEKTPSFMVSAELQIYKCFGCGESGDIFTFLQKNEGLEFYEALQILAKRAGVEISSRKGSNLELKNKIKQVNSEAARFYHYILKKHPSGKAARFYLQKRGISTQTIDEFKLGFAPPKSSVLSKYLQKKKGFEKKILEDSGVCFPAKYGLMDRFRGRIIFPIHNHREEVIALAGRILPEFDNGSGAKYINSPETLVYSKSQSLYGIEKAKSYIKRTGNAVLVEGEIDMLSSWQSQVKNTVALKGTAMTQEQIHLLSRFTEKITLALDSDFAGDNAALRGITLAQNHGMEIKVVDLGKYKDPDEFARENPQGFIQAISEAEDVWSFLLKLAQERFDLSSGQGKSKAANFYLTFLNKLTDPVLKDHYLKEFAEKIGTNASLLRGQVTGSVQNGERDPNVQEKGTKTNSPRSRRLMLEEEVLRMGLASFPERLAQAESSFSHKKFRKIAKLAGDKEKFDLKSFVEDLPQDLSQVVKEIIIAEKDLEVGEKDFERAYLELQLTDARAQLYELSERMRELESRKQKKSLMQKIQREFNKIAQRISRLEEKRNSSII